MLIGFFNTTGGKAKKTKPDGSMVQWTEEGRVQLLSIAEKAGVEDPQNKPEKDHETEVTDMTDGTTAASAPVATTEPPSADDEAKEDDKHIVTVATFGFPEVSIQPSSQAEGEVSETGETKNKENQENGSAKNESKPSESVQVC